MLLHDLSGICFIHTYSKNILKGLYIRQEFVIDSKWMRLTDSRFARFTILKSESVDNKMRLRLFLLFKLLLSLLQDVSASITCSVFDNSMRAFL